MKYRILFTILSTSFLISGCAATTPPASPSTTIYTPAPNADQQTTVTQYVPVPIPGQLMPTPTQANIPAAPAYQTATAAVDSANTQATQIPNSSQFFNAMMTYAYMSGALYTIYSAPMKITDIALAPGEKLISEAAGDTLR